MGLFAYELKKMVTKRTNRIIFLLLALLVASTSMKAVNQVEWIDERGNPITGHEAAVKLRQESQPWTGILDRTLLEKALGEIQEIYSTVGKDARPGENNYPLRSKLQGIGQIADLLGAAYVDEYDTYEEMVQALQPEDLSRFYENRVTGIKDFLYREENWGYSNYTEEEKHYILEQYDSLQTPFQVGYQEGWDQASDQIPSLMKSCAIVLSFLLAGIFSDEFSWKTDGVYYNTYHGRTKSTALKILLGFLTVTVMYWLCMGMFTLIVLGSLGTDGAGYLIQSYPGNWNVRHTMTFSQYYGLILGAGYLGFLFLGFLVMWISAKTKSSVLAVLIPSVMLLLPMFLREIYSLFLRKVIGMLPHWLMDMGQLLEYQYLYKIGEKVMTAAPIVLTVYPCVSLLLAVLCYREYRHKQIT